MKKNAGRGQARQSTMVTMRRKKFIVNQERSEEIDSRVASETATVIVCFTWHNRPVL